MKTERRHELHTNALADWLGDQIERLRPYSRLAAAGVVAAVVALGLYGYLASQSSHRNEEGWKRFDVAYEALRQKGDAEDLVQLAQSSEFAGTSVGYWAALNLADFHLNEGINQLFSDRAAAAKSLRSAVDEYAQVSKQTQLPMLADRAVLGIARAYESLNELDNARKHYEQLASKVSGPFAVDAQQRLRDLGQDSTKRFYDWFFAATPPRQGLEGPGTPGMRPNFGSLPDEGSFKTPEAESDSLLRTPKAKDEQAAEAAADKPADGPAEAAPNTDAPAADKPPSDGPPSAGPASDGPASDGPASDGPASSPQ